MSRFASAMGGLLGLEQYFWETKDALAIATDVDLEKYLDHLAKCQEQLRPASESIQIDNFERL